MKVWAVANQKDGVGKTTTAITLAGLLAKQGQRVMLMDLDPQGSMTSYFGYNPGLMKRSVYNLFRLQRPSTESDVQRLLLRTSIHDVYLAPASVLLASLDRGDNTKGGLGLVVAKALDTVATEFDYVIIDNAHTLGVLMINALAACHRLLIPVQTELLAIKGLERMMRTLHMVMQSQNKDLDYVIVPTMFDRQTQASMISLRTLRNTYPNKIWSSMIPIDTRFRDASRKGVAPSSLSSIGQGVRAYENLLDKMITEDQRAAEQQALGQKTSDHLSVLSHV